MRKKLLSYLFLILIVLSIFSLIIKFGTKPVYSLLGYQPKAGLKITSLPESTVYLNQESVGKTPYINEELLEGEYQVKLESGDKKWEGSVKLNTGTVTVLNRELSESLASSSGEVLHLYEGKGVVITSAPTGASVEIDGKMNGHTPLSVNNLSNGEHTFLLKHPNYLPRSVRATMPDNLLLNIHVDLSISDSVEVNTPAPTIVVQQKVVVTDTPTGFLRVRDNPSVLGKEVTRVKPGDELILLEETQGWSKVRLQDETEGYVSSDYLEKKN